MSEEKIYSTRQEFAALVHDALSNLYDSPKLETHPLGDLLIPLERHAYQRAQELRRILLAAIRSIQPEPNTPQKSRDWRAYRILELRYISGLNPAEAMTQLALSRSFFFNEQARVLDTLVELLWNQRIQPVTNHPIYPSAEMTEGEINRLLEQVNWEAVDAVALINDMMSILLPLAKINEARIEINLSQPLSIWHTDRVLLRQVLLTLIAKGMTDFKGSSINIDTFSSEGKAGIAVRIKTSSGSNKQKEIEQQHGLSLDTCQRLLAKMMGKIVFDDFSPQRREIRLEWPTKMVKSLLVIDDNMGMIDLLTRYLVQEDWQVLSAANGMEARQRLNETYPTIILLDVILPQEDGWELLLALKKDERTSNIPVIVCSAINEPQLAASLGAAAYLLKPVTQQALLQVLKRWTQVGASSEPGR